VADRSNRTSTQSLVDSLFREVSSHAVTQTRDLSGVPHLSPENA